MPRSASKPSTRPPGSSARFDVVVVGVSAGGVDLLLELLPWLPGDFPVPIVVCLHAAQGTTLDLAAMLNERSRLEVSEAVDKERPRPGHVYLAPGGYHLLLESDGAFGLSIDAPVRFARPAVDVLFDSAAHVHRERVLGVVLTGANDDGAQGARRIKAAGGMVIVQDPATAVAPDMPRAALAAVKADHCVPPGELAKLLQRLCKGRHG
jgi:two-component system, chemotaxis family, protein-glutamate methylesterase/glutaminase